MEQLVAHLSQQMSEWPSQQLQALEIILNSPFINNTASLLYASRTIFELQQVRVCSLKKTHTLLSIIYASPSSSTVEAG